MKKTRYIYPFLFALYPVLGLYARNLTEIQPWEVVRPSLIAMATTTFAVTMLSHFTKDPARSAFLSAFIIFFYSASGLTYRVIQGYIVPELGESFHRILLLVVTIFLLILGSRSVWDKYMPLARREILSKYLNLVSAIVLVFPLFTISAFWIQAWNDAPQPWSSYVGRGEPSQILSPEQRPDIYYIIMDGYGREDVLQSLYGYDNSIFLSGLQKRGFYIANKSQSNYLRTSLSVTSSLNMEYLDFAAGLAGPKSINRIPMFELASNNRVRQLLESAGYKMVLIDSGSAFTRFYNAEYFITPFQTRPNLFEMWFYGTTALSALYEPELPFTPSLQSILPIASYSAHRTFILGALDSLSTAHKIPGQKFIFAHIIAPHPPFVLGEDGNSLHPNYPYVTGDGNSFVSNKDAYKQGYIDQVKYLNARILKTVDTIIANSSQPPIIILQSDHGPGLLLISGDTVESCLWERASIMNAYYFPQQKTDLLYDSISPVNSFRVVFNTYFNTSYALLPDKTYYSRFEVPYDFIEITDKVRNACDAAP